MLVNTLKLYDGDNGLNGRSFPFVLLRPRYILPTNSDTLPFFTVNVLLFTYCPPFLIFN